MSRQERVSWLSLVTTVVTGCWYFHIVFTSPAEAALHGPAMAGFVTKLIVIAIIIGIVGEVLMELAHRHVHGGGADATSADERDSLIHLKATRNAHVALSLGVILVLAQIALLEWARAAPELPRPVAPSSMLEQLYLGPLSALHVAQSLLLVLTLAGITLYGSRVLYYRRGH